jgi:hypothetical protein
VSLLSECHEFAENTFSLSVHFVSEVTITGQQGW